MTSAKHCIGIIGLGSIGRRHATNLYKHLGQTEVIGYDIELKDKVGWVISDLDELLRMATAVVICSPTEDHIGQANYVASHSKPMFIEKPFGEFMPIKESSIMDNLHLVKMVGYNLRFHPCVIKAKEWLDAGDIGDPLWANFTLGQHSVKPPYLRDGVILNWSHEIDLAIHLLGNGSVAHSSTRVSDGKDELVDILFTHESFCMSTIHLDYLTKPEVRQSIIVGTKGQIILDLVSHNTWLRDVDGAVVEHVQGDGWDQTYIDEMQAFIDRIEGKETIGCTAEEGLKVLEVCLEVRKQAGL